MKQPTRSYRETPGTMSVYREARGSGKHLTHIVIHHHYSDGGKEEYHFSRHQGEEAVHHVAHHMNVNFPNFKPAYEQEEEGEHITTKAGPHRGGYSRGVGYPQPEN